MIRASPPQTPALLFSTCPRVEGWHYGVMDRGFDAQAFLGSISAQGGLGLREVPNGASRPISRTPMCCFPPVHSPSSELSSRATETSGGKVRTRVRAPQLLFKWIPHSFFPKPSNCHPFNASPHPGKYLEGSECSEAASRKRGFNCHLSLGA